MRRAVLPCRMGSCLRTAAMLLAAALPVGAFSPPAMAEPAAVQFAVDPGEAIAARRLDVLSAATPDAAKVMEVEAGRTVTVLGYPRGTGMAWIAIRGRELGYVNAAFLAPIDRQRPILYRAAIVAKSRAGAGGVLPGDQLNKSGELVTLTAVARGKATLDNTRIREVPAEELVPVIGTYGTGSLDPSSPAFFAARFGRFATLAEAQGHWSDIQQLLPELAGMAPYLFRRTTAEGIGVELAAGPFSRARVEEVCTMLARRGRDCWTIAVDVR